MTKQNLYLTILPSAQRRLWDELRDVPETFILYGGTAIALQIGHRHSVDFDFFVFEHSSRKPSSPLSRFA